MQPVPLPVPSGPAFGRFVVVLLNVCVKRCSSKAKSNTLLSRETVCSCCCRCKGPRRCWWACRCLRCLLGDYVMKHQHQIGVHWPGCGLSLSLILHAAILEPDLNGQIRCGWIISNEKISLYMGVLNWLFNSDKQTPTPGVVGCVEIVIRDWWII